MGSPSRLAEEGTLARGPCDLDLLPGDARAGGRVVHTGNHLGPTANTYIPCAGFALLVGARRCRQGGGRPAARGSWHPVAVVALGLARPLDRGPRPAARAQSAVWHDPETLWRHAIEVDPGLLHLLHNLASSAAPRRSPRPWPCLSRAICLRPDQSEFHGNYGPPPDPDGPARDGTPGSATVSSAIPATSSRAQSWASPCRGPAAPPRPSPSSSRRSASSPTPCRP